MKHYDKYRYMPFNFKELNNSKYIVTNQTSSFVILKDIEELKNLIYLRLDRLEIETINELIAKNFLYEQNEENFKLNIFSTNLATKFYNNLNKNSLFLIIPTLRCDLDCKYCQVSRVNENKKGFDLEVSYIEEIIRVINLCSDTNIKIEFQGGEPLLNFDFIKEFYMKAQERLASKHITYVICTTLTNVNDEILNWCNKNSVFISTSLDGDKAIHNYNRPSKNYDSFDKFKEKLFKSREVMGNNSISAISTVTKQTMEDPLAFVNSYLALEFNSIFIRPLNLLGFAYQNNNEQYDAQTFFEFYEKCLEYIFEINSTKLFIEENMLIYLKKIFRPLTNNYLDMQSPSAYMNGVLVFNYNGLIFGSDEARMLWEMTKLDSLVLGDIKAKKYYFDNEANINILSNSFIEMNPGCNDCSYVEYCGNDVFYHLATQGDMIGNKSSSFYCQLQILIFNYIFELLDSNSKNKEVLYKWLNY